MKEVEAVILAGGEGSRMGPLTRDTQKCLLSIDGEPVMYHILEELIKAFGSVDVKIAISYKADQVKEYVDRIKPKAVSITYVPHERAAGTYGAYRTMEHHVRGPFVGLPGDVIARAKAYENVFTVFQNSVDSPVAISLSPNVGEADTHGIAKIKDSIVTDYIATPSRNVTIPPDYLRELDIISGANLFFSMLREYPAEDKDMSTTLSKAVASGRKIAAYLYDEEWIHVAYLDDLRKSIPWKPTGI